MIGKEETWFTYGLVARIPLDKLGKLKQYIQENDIEIVYDKVSASKLILKEAPLPHKSGNGEDDEQ